MTNQDIKFVAFLDVLGFSVLLQNNDIEYIHNIFKRVFQNLNNRDMVGESHSVCGEEYSCTADLTIQMISDSIVIWTKDSSHLSLSTLVSACNNLLYSCLNEGLPLRGAISVGTLNSIQIDNPYNISSVIGNAITKAHNLEKSQKWMGCIIDQECFDVLGVDWWQVIKGPKNEVIEYDVPYEKGVKNHLVLNWCNWLYENEVDNMQMCIKDNFNAHSKRNDRPDTKTKIENTIEYFKYIMKNNLFVNESIR
jgi:hypothetical protein